MLTATRSASWARSASSLEGTSVTVTPRCCWAAKGKVTLVNSSPTVTTRVPSGTEAATRPRSAEAEPPMLTAGTVAPTRSA